MDYITILDFFCRFQDNFDYVEVYHEDANVVLMDGGETKFEEDDLLFRAPKAFIEKAYGYSKILRWDVKDGVIRIALWKAEPPAAWVVEEHNAWAERTKEFEEWTQEKNGKENDHGA